TRLGGGIASVHDSGGERALFADLAADEGVPFAVVADATLVRVAETLDPGVEAANPLDAWGTGIDADRIFRETFLAFADDPEVAAMAFVVDLTSEGEPFDEGYLRVANEVWTATEVPFCVLSNLASAVSHDEATMLRDAGIPVLEGTATGLQALRHLLDDARFRSREVGRRAPSSAEDVRMYWAERLKNDDPIDPSEAFALLSDFGVPTVASRIAEEAAGAVAAAEEIGFPIVLKT